MFLPLPFRRRIPAETAHEDQCHGKTQQLRAEGGEPDAAAAPERRQQEQCPGLQHQPPAHGDAQGGAGPLHRRQEAAHEDIEAHRRYFSGSLRPYWKLTSGWEP